MPHLFLIHQELYTFDPITVGCGGRNLEVEGNLSTGRWRVGLVTTTTGGRLVTFVFCADGVSPIIRNEMAKIVIATMVPETSCFH